MASDASPDSVPLLSARGRLVAGICLALANFTVILDLTIANVAVPHIAGNLGVTMEQGTWVISSYAVAEAICVPLAGWLAMRFGSVRLFIAALAGFGLFSLLCGMSVSLPMLVACRIGQGLCGAPIMPMSQTLMLRIFQGEHRARAMAVWSTTVMLGPAMGPLLGGIISDNLSWHWVFLINVPIAATVVAVCFFLLPPVETLRKKVPIDLVGLALLIFWVACLQILLDTGRDRGWFDDTRIVMLGLGAAIGFAAFLIWELTEDHPVVDLRIFRHPRYSFAIVTMGVSFAAFFAGIVVVPQWLQGSLGYPATIAGSVGAGHAFVAFLTAFFIPRLMQKYDIRYIVAIGVAWMGITSLARAAWTSTAGLWDYAIPMATQGVGIAFMAIPLITMSLSSVEPDEMASAAGLQNFVRTMAVAVATAVSLSVWDDAQRQARVEVVSTMHPGQAQSALEGAGLSNQQMLEVLSRMADSEALTMALNHVFLVAAAMLFLSSLIILMAPKAPILPNGPLGGH